MIKQHPKRLLAFILPRSIQKRLPISYAAIALLVALSLGGVLVGILSEYYHQQEIDYLTRNAMTIKTSLAHMLETNTSDDDLQAQVNLFAFLSRTHVEVLDRDEVLRVASENLLTVVDLDEQQPGVRLIVRQRQGDEVWLGLPSATMPAIATTKTEFVTHDGVFIETVNTDGMVEQNISVDFLAQTEDDQKFTRAVVAGEDQVFVSYASGLYGSGLAQTQDQFMNWTQSSQSITTPITDPDGELLGMLRISQGPAYGVEIVSSVAWGWLFASLFSITLAIIVGYFISRDVSQPLHILTETTKQMATGDLSARANLQREDEFGTLANAFNNMATQIESTVSTLHHFVSDAAHEINTPITALRTNLELITSDQATDQNQVTLSRALDQVTRLQDLTRDLLQLSRLESSMSDDTLQPINITALLRETVGFYASRADQANIELELSFRKQPVIYTANDTHLRTAIANLIDNAIKFTPTGGRVSISLEASRDEIAIHIRDTGVGIPPDHLPYVFNRFHRASNVSSYAGSGLGLSIVSTIIERYKGSLSIKNLECGIRVSIFLPCNNSSDI